MQEELKPLKRASHPQIAMKGKKGKMEDSVMTMMMLKRCKFRTCDDSKREKTLLDLPNDILKLIFKHLYYVDQINFRAVCKSLHSMDKIQPRNPVPWRLGFDSMSSCCITDPAYQKVHKIVDINIKEKKLYNMQVHDSKCGWMLMSSISYRPPGYSFLLYAPLLAGINNIIDLPFLHTEFRIATFSSNPLEEDCLFLALSQNAHCGDVVSVSTCRRGDKTWRTQNFECDVPLHHVKNVVYFGGTFYCPSFQETTIWTYNVGQQNWVALAPGKSTLTSYVWHCQRHLHRIQTDEDGELVLVLFDHLQVPSCSYFVPWPYFPGSLVPKLGLSKGAKRKEKHIDWRKIVRQPGFKAYVASEGLMEED